MERIVPPVAKHGHAQPKAFAAETAALTGQSKQEINRQLAVGKALGDDTLRVVGTSLDKGVELAALAKMPEPQRKDLIERAAAGEKVIARTAPPVPTPPATPPAPAQPPVAGPLDSTATAEDATRKSGRCLNPAAVPNSPEPASSARDDVSKPSAPMYPMTLDFDFHRWWQ